jgi:hypothetical protein
MAKTSVLAVSEAYPIFAWKGEEKAMKIWAAWLSGDRRVAVELHDNRRRNVGITHDQHPD